MGSTSEPRSPIFQPVGPRRGALSKRPSAPKFSHRNLSAVHFPVPFPKFRLWGSTSAAPSGKMLSLPFQRWATSPSTLRAVWGRRRSTRSPLRPRSFVLRVVVLTLPTLAPCEEFTPALFSRSRGVINPARPWVALPCSKSLAHCSPLLFQGAFGWADGDGSLSISVDARALHRGLGTSLVPSPLLRARSIASHLAR